jgi:cytochrome bd-type quinol oxidase subunit 2
VTIGIALIAFASVVFAAIYAYLAHVNTAELIKKSAYEGRWVLRVGQAVVVSAMVLGSNLMSDAHRKGHEWWAVWAISVVVVIVPALVIQQVHNRRVRRGNGGSGASAPAL